jgi:hypothetical protein
VRQRPRVPSKLGPMAPPGGVPTWQHLRVGQQTQGPPGQTGTRDSALASLSARPGGGDADPDTTLACSRAAPSGGLDFPLRRLTAIRDGRSWRRDTLADPTTTDNPISRRSVVVYGARHRQAWGAASQSRRPVLLPPDTAGQQQAQAAARPVAAWRTRHDEEGPEPDAAGTCSNVCPIQLPA